MVQRVRCRACRGTGRRSGDECASCRGDGLCVRLPWAVALRRLVWRVRLASRLYLALVRLRLREIWNAH